MAGSNKKAGPIDLLFSVHLNVTILSALAIAVIVLLLLFWNLPQYRAEITFTAALIGGGTTLCSAFFAAKTLQTHLTRDKQRKSFEILDRLGESGAVRLRTFIEKEVDNQNMAPAALYQKVIADIELLTAVSHVLGLFEDASIAIQEGYADEVALWRSLDYLVPWTFRSLQPFIDEERKRSGDPRLYQHMQALAEAWQQNCSVVTHESLPA